MSVASENYTLAELKGQISELSHKLERMSSDFGLDRGRERSRGRSNNRRNATSRNRSATPRSTQNDFQDRDVCWYHSKFGSRARKCNSPCSFQNSSGNALGQLQ